MASKKPKTTAPEPAENSVAPAKVVFSKSKILKLKRFANRRDACSVILKDNESYTLDQVESLIQNFMKGKVK